MARVCSVTHSRGISSWGRGGAGAHQDRSSVGRYRVRAAERQEVMGPADILVGD